MARLTFVLPTVQRLPVGGYKVPYEYANRFAARGHQVTIVHPFGGLSNNIPFWLATAKQGLRSASIVAGLVPWFEFRPNVLMRLVPRLSPRFMPGADVTILTGWQTTRAVGRAEVRAGLRSTSPKSTVPGLARLGRLFQLVYDYEFWLTANSSRRAQIAKSLTDPRIQKVATSTAVQGMLAQLGQAECPIVTAGLDVLRFRNIIPQRDRKPMVLFPLRRGSFKGASDACEALSLVRSLRPDARMVCFGEARGVDMPKWIERLGRVSDDQLAALYSEAQVFLLPSRAEGWGLPAAEAMASGAAVVTAANGGTEDFAISEVTALVVPPANPRAMAAAVLRILGDIELRNRLATAGAAMAGAMTWDRAFQELAVVLGISIN